MKRFLLFAALLFTSQASAATISSASCPGTGCSVSFVADTLALAVQVTGTWSGSITVELSNDNVTFVPARAFPVGGGAYTPEFTANGGWTVPTGGMAYFRVRAASWTSGTATVTTRPTGAFIAADVVRSVGSTFGAVDISGTVSLSSNSLSALGSEVCTVAEAHRHALTTTPEVIATHLPDGGSSPIAGRSSWTVVNVDAIKRVACRKDPGDGGLPDCSVPGNGFTVYPSGGLAKIPVRESDTVRCVACTNGATIEHMEEACVSP